MADFADILFELETQRAGDDARRARWRGALRALPLMEPAPYPAARTDFVRTGYEGVGVQPKRLTLETIAQEIDRVRASPNALRRLRRRLARGLHPDRWRDASDAGLLASCNAMIDAARIDAARDKASR